jgi:NADPH2:quinone reductase
MRVVRFQAYGGPEVLRYEEVPDPAPGPGQVLIKVDAAGVNFIDVYHRTGLYPLPLPATPGLEAAGTIAAAGPGVTEFRTGNRVAYQGPPGGYAEYALVPAQRVVPLPDGISTRQGAAALLQGMTAHYLASSTYPLGPGDACLVHAAAGGVGPLLCQIAKRRGARVFGTVSTPQKAARARESGADEVILYTEKDFEAEVMRLTSGSGVQVVYDSVGQMTFEKSLRCLAPRGMLALYGQASGPVAPFDPQLLNQRGSVFLTRPSLVHYTAARTELLDRANDVLGWVGDGTLRLHIGLELPLSRAAEAHRRLQARETTGKVLLIPEG